MRKQAKGPEPVADRGRGNWVEANLLVEFLVYLLASVPGENIQQPFLGWRKKEWAWGNPLPSPSATPPFSGLGGTGRPTWELCPQSWDRGGRPGTRGGGGAELTSEASEGHCAKLVVSVHSLKLRGEGHRVKVGCWLSTALPALFLQIYAPAGLLAH